MLRRLLKEGKTGCTNKRPINLKKGSQQNAAPSKNVTLISIDSSSSDTSTISDDEPVETSKQPENEIEIVKELQVTQETQHRCDLCCEGEFLIDRLLRFGGLINETFKFVCDKCDKNFKHKSEVQKHSTQCNGPQVHQDIAKASVMKDVELLFCSICSKSFKSQAGFTKHMKSQHSDLTHTCEVCKISFNNFQQFRHHCSEHQKNHKTHACPECEKRFIHRYSLKKHREKIHKIVN